MLQLDDITAGYGDALPLFSGLSLSVARGEMRLVQGASGCGKSTLLGIICGTSDAALKWSGDVGLNDRSISPVPAEDRRVGLIFQDALLFPHMTVADNLAFGLAARHRRDRDARVAEALGIAFQITNILRDVGEDAVRGRIYLPREDMDRFGVTEKQIFDGRIDDNYRELIKFEIARARADEGASFGRARRLYPCTWATPSTSRSNGRATRRRAPRSTTC